MSYSTYSQSHISTQLKVYLDTIGNAEGKKREVTLNFSPYGGYQGDCNGYSFLFGFYHNAHKSKEFSDTLSYIKNWNGNLQSLYSNNGLTQELKKKYKNGKEVFEQTINDIAWFSHITNPIAKIQPKVTYWDRMGQWEVAANEKHKLTKLFSFDYDNVYNTFGGRSDMAVAFSKNNLPEALKIFNNWKDSWLDITVQSSQGAHEVSVYISANGTYTFYDPNDGHLPYESASHNEISRNIFDSLGYDTSVREIRSFKVIPLDHRSVDDDMTANKTLFTHQNATAVETILKMAFESHQYDLFYKVFNILEGDINKLVRKYGEPALNESVKLGHYDLAKLMLDKGVDINSPGKVKLVNADSLLIDTVKKGDVKMAALLIEYGADVNQKGYLGKTPLIHAAEKMHTPLFSLLIDHGANVNTKDVFGNSAKTLANKSLHFEIIDTINRAEMPEFKDVKVKNLYDAVISIKDIFSSNDNITEGISSLGMQSSNIQSLNTQSSAMHLPPSPITQLIQEMVHLTLDS